MSQLLFTRTAFNVFFVKEQIKRNLFGKDKYNHRHIDFMVEQILHIFLVSFVVKYTSANIKEHLDLFDEITYLCYILAMKLGWDWLWESYSRSIQSGRVNNSMDGDDDDDNRSSKTNGMITPRAVRCYRYFQFVNHYIKDIFRLILTKCWIQWIIEYNQQTFRHGSFLEAVFFFVIQITIFHLTIEQWNVFSSLSATTTTPKKEIQEIQTDLLNLFAVYSIQNLYGEFIEYVNDHNHPINDDDYTWIVIRIFIIQVIVKEYIYDKLSLANLFLLKEIKLLFTHPWINTSLSNLSFLTDTGGTIAYWFIRVIYIAVVIHVVSWVVEKSLWSKNEKRVADKLIILVILSSVQDDTVLDMLTNDLFAFFFTLLLLVYSILVYIEDIVISYQKEMTDNPPLPRFSIHSYRNALQIQLKFARTFMSLFIANVIYSYYDRNVSHHLPNHPWGVDFLFYIFAVSFFVAWMFEGDITSLVRGPDGDDNNK